MFYIFNLKLLIDIILYFLIFKYLKNINEKNIK